MVGKLIGPPNVDQTEAYKSTLFAVQGMGPHFEIVKVARTLLYHEGGDGA